MMAISHAARRGSRCAASTRASDARPRGRGRHGRACVVEQSRAERGQQAAAAVVRAAAAQADHEPAHAPVEQRARRARPGRASSALATATRIPAASVMPTTCATSMTAGESRRRCSISPYAASSASPAAPVTRARWRCPARRPPRARRRACPSPPSAIGRARIVDAGHGAREAARERVAHLGRGQRALERVGCEDDAHGVSSWTRQSRSSSSPRVARARRSRTACHAASAGTASMRIARRAARVERAQVRVEVVRVAHGSAGASIHCDARHVSGRAHGAREHGNADRPRARRSPPHRRAATACAARSATRACPTRAAHRAPVRAARGRARARARSPRCRRAAAASARRRETRRSCSRCRRRTRRRRGSARRRRRDRRRRAARWSARCGRSDWPTARRCRAAGRGESRAGARAPPDATARAGPRCPGRR